MHISDASTHQPIPDVLIEVFAKQVSIASGTSGADGVAFIKFQYKLGSQLIVTTTKHAYVPNSALWKPLRLPGKSSFIFFYCFSVCLICDKHIYREHLVLTHMTSWSFTLSLPPIHILSPQSFLLSNFSFFFKFIFWTCYIRKTNFAWLIYFTHILNLSLKQTSWCWVVLMEASTVITSEACVSQEDLCIHPLLYPQPLHVQGTWGQHVKLVAGELCVLCTWRIESFQVSAHFSSIPRCTFWMATGNVGSGSKSACTILICL